MKYVQQFSVSFSRARIHMGKVMGIFFIAFLCKRAKKKEERDKVLMLVL
jgi:hypothetical protein